MNFAPIPVPGIGLVKYKEYMLAMHAYFVASTRYLAGKATDKSLLHSERRNYRQMARGQARDARQALINYKED